MTVDCATFFDNGFEVVFIPRILNMICCHCFGIQLRRDLNYVSKLISLTHLVFLDQFQLSYCEMLFFFIRITGISTPADMRTHISRFNS
jgi:hypothetical protein